MFAPPHDPKAASSIKDVLVPCLLATVGALAIVCGWQRAELRRLAATPKPSPAEVQPALHRARAQTLVVAPSNRAATRAPFMREDDGAEFTPAPVPFAPKRPAPPESPLARLLSNPEFSQAFQLHRQATLDARFAPLFRQLGLEAEELAAFKRLLTERETVALDVIAVSETQPEGPLPAPMLTASVNAARARVEDAIRTTLGAERYALYSEFEKSLPHRAVVAQLEQRLSYSPTPLSPTQAESLVKILTVRAPATTSTETAPTSAMVVAAGALAAGGFELRSPTTVLSHEVIAEAQSLLSPNQAAALRQIQSEQQATAQAMQLIRASLPGEDMTAALARQLLLQ